MRLSGTRATDLAAQVEFVHAGKDLGGAAFEEPAIETGVFEVADTGSVPTCDITYRLDIV